MADNASWEINLISEQNGNLNVIKPLRRRMRKTKGNIQYFVQGGEEIGQG